jgi:transposase
MAVSEKTLVRRARRDLAKGLDADQARFLVDFYYAIQDFRIRAEGQVRALAQGKDTGTFEIGDWLSVETRALEEEIVPALDAWAKAHVPGRWMQSIHGIGPVIAAGFLAHIDITRAPTVGHIWRYAGLDPTVKWGKGQKRPWNAGLKVLCWKTADSFVKQRNNPKDVYGKVYEERKALEVERNLAGRFANQAAASLRDKKIRDPETRAVYEAGQLPAGRLDMRARRYAVKLFLAHGHHVMYEDHYGEPPPKPYALTHLEHAHFISPPNWPMA